MCIDFRVSKSKRESENADNIKASPKALLKLHANNGRRAIAVAGHSV